MRSRFNVALLAAIVTALLAAMAAPAAATPSHVGRWSGAWATAVQRPSETEWSPNWSEEGFENHSVRQVLRVGAGGSKVRIRLSNVYGERPLRLTGATVGRAGAGADVRPGTIRPVTFGRSRSTTIPAGRRAASDPVRLPVKPLDRLSVTLYFKGTTGPATFHDLALTTSYRATGDHRSDTGAGAFNETSTSWYYLSGVDVSGKRGQAGHATNGAVVALGDSITDGFGATPEAYNNYPDQLAERLVAAGRRAPVLNVGIGGNRVLNDSACFGEKATARFGRDVLDQPRVKTVIVLEGINDIGFSEFDFPPCTVPNPEVSAEELIDGHRKLIKAARARGIKIIGGTLLPFKGAQYFTDRGEKVRKEVNDWIRNSGAYDAVVDFDRALADPADPERLRPAYDSGDALHPSDAGYDAMAAAVELDAL